jgi:hypothetical protein
MSFRVVVRIEQPLQTTRFVFSQERLAAKSRFFNKAFGGSFLEATTRSITFDDILIEDFSKFSHWVLTERLLSCPLDTMIRLYVLADRLDVPALRAAITDQLTTTCFKLDFKVPELELIRFMMENISKFMPIHTLLAIAVARVLYHDPEGLLDSLPYGFGVRVRSNLDKPCGICNKCYHDNNNPDDTDQCEHFLDEPTDFDPKKYHETANGNTE